MFIVHKYLIAEFWCFLPNNNSSDKEENIKSLSKKYCEDLESNPYLVN
jgi:hypothetical protein